jgi:hypothetical protein
MNTTGPTKSIKPWQAPDVMDAVKHKGQAVDHRYQPHAHSAHYEALQALPWW